MQTPFSYPQASSQPLTLSKSVESQVYGLFALAIAFTLIGVFVGMTFAALLFQSGVLLLLLVAEIAIIFTSSLWVHRSPLNMILFIAFPLLSGITFTPYVMLLLSQYANGASILLNALGATVFLSLAAAVFARTTSINLMGMGRFLLFGLVGLIVLGLLQLFIPVMRTGPVELLISGIGVGLFSLLLAFDLQRIQAMGRVDSASPFLMALSLYLDVYNLFMYVLRLMMALSGDRR